MKLVKFRVTNFRSVKDSGWIDTDQITSLIGTNESGKTNILIALWKLKPAKDGTIDPIADFPRKSYHEIRASIEKPIFIEAVFELQEELRTELSRKAKYSPDQLRFVSVKRDYAGNYLIGFPDVLAIRYICSEELVEVLKNALDEIQGLKSLKSEEGARNELLAELQIIIGKLSSNETGKIYEEELREMHQVISSKIPVDRPKTSMYIPRIIQLQDELNDLVSRVTIPLPEDLKGVKDQIVHEIPPFVYYSNYGNLDSEIYLPHVIENLNRTDLGMHEEAKARTLKVLFEFVKLKPEEILELGKDIAGQPGQPSEEEIKRTAARKKERDILLQSASTQLTDSFRGWWQQGDYRFRFQADGNHFRIWVSDDKRPEDIELEARSSGLQWFFSFYLIFLVESSNSHKNAILLLDEPGLTLHPIAQRDLSDFFESLSQTNELLYTAHSPFMVDPDQLDRVKAVYVGDDGTTRVSSDLRAVDNREQQSRSIYPVYAALGLSVSDTLLEGCQGIIVEGPSDQYYLTAIKNYLIGNNLINPQREILFLPSGGVSGVKAIIPIISGKNEELPYVLLDADTNGCSTAKSLRTNLYKGFEHRVLLTDEFVGFPNSEIEDIFPTGFLADVLTKYLRGPEEDFSEVVIDGQPIIPQVEAYAEKYEIVLTSGWKVDVAKLVKNRLLRAPNQISHEDDVVNIWRSLFGKFLS